MPSAVNAPGRPNRLSLGTGWSNVENAMTQPSWLARRQAGMCLKSPPIPVLPFTSTLPPIRIADSRRLRTAGLRSISLAITASSTPGPLRVADEHEAPAVVVVLQVVLERAFDVAHPKRRIGLGARRSAEARAGERDLAVHRRVHLAVLRVPADLVERDRLLGVLDLQVAVAGLLVAYRRVDVEAIDRWLALRLRVLDADRLGERGVVTASSRAPEYMDRA